MADRIRNTVVVFARPFTVAGRVKTLPVKGGGGGARQISPPDYPGRVVWKAFAPANLGVKATGNRGMTSTTETPAPAPGGPDAGQI